MPRPDILELQDKKEVDEGFSRLVSGGKYGYKTIIDRKKEQPKCKNCGSLLKGSEKFCPECGAKVEADNKEKAEEKTEIKG